MRTDQSLAVEPLILTVRGQRVILSSDLAGVYGVQPRALNQAVKRNLERFPPDFAFRLTRREAVQARRSRSYCTTSSKPSSWPARRANPRSLDALHCSGFDRQR